LALILQTILDAPIIELDTIDSTNNYAMRLIDADTAQPGMTILAQQQTGGKGQRGRTWLDIPGQSILMSIICVPMHKLDEQFIFNACVITGIADVLQGLNENWDIRIKWPNDIIVNDKKAGGVLIENVLRGSNWSYSIIGIGLNVLQPKLDESLVYGTSLKIESGINYPVYELAGQLRTEILKNIYTIDSKIDIMKRYNNYLFHKGQDQAFVDATGREWKARVIDVSDKGLLRVQLADGSITGYVHGVANWKWE